MNKIEQLFVLWRDRDGGRHIIGRLRHTKDGYEFSYAGADTLPLESNGFMLPVEFPNRHQVYRAGYLFPTFAQRIPSPSRPDRSRLFEAWGVTNADDQLGILAQSGGVLITDRLELAEYRSDEDDLQEPLEFRVAGASQAQFAEVAKKVQVNDILRLINEPGNVYDEFATIVLEANGGVLGYVPKQYSRFVAQLLRANVPLTATAMRLLAMPDSARWVIRVARA